MAELNEAVRQLIDRRNLADLVTLMRDGSPQVTPLWVDHDGTYVLVNTAKGRQKHRNVVRDPRVALCIVDDVNKQHYVQIRGHVVEMIEGDAAWQHFLKLANKYRPGSDMATRQPDPNRVILRIEPEHVQLYGS